MNSLVKAFIATHPPDDPWLDEPWTEEELRLLREAETQEGVLWDDDQEDK